VAGCCECGDEPSGSCATELVSYLFACTLVWGSLRRWSACAPTAYEVARDCRMFEKYCVAGCLKSCSESRVTFTWAVAAVDGVTCTAGSGSFCQG
jgi:hypothetical protein